MDQCCEGRLAPAKPSFPRRRRRRRLAYAVIWALCDTVPPSCGAATTWAECRLQPPAKTRVPPFIPRGGGADDVVDTVDESNATLVTVNDESPETTETKSLFSWLWGESPERWSPHLSQNASRGGALVQPRTTWSSRIANQARWMQLRTEDLTSLPQRIPHSVRRIWWVDTWADHILNDSEEIDVPLEEDEEEETEESASSSDEFVQSEAALERTSEERWSVGVVSESSMGTEPVPSFAVNDTLVQQNEPDNQTTRSSSSLYLSSGYWQSIDRALTWGYASDHPDWRISSHLRSVRKTMAHITGLHGVLSGKPSAAVLVKEEEVEDATMGLVRRRLAAIDRARRNLDRLSAAQSAKERKRFFWQPKKEEEAAAGDAPESLLETNYKTLRERQEEERRKLRVNEIDQQMQAAQQRLMELACEKDVLQRRPNPLWNYTTTTKAAEAPLNNKTAQDSTAIAASRDFNFPPPDLVDEYLDMLFATGRLIKMNHTDLWRNGDDDQDDDEEEWSRRGEDLRIPRNSGNGGGSSAGSWLLRNGLGEKIGETAETAAYKAVCAALMSVLARSISSLHGVNVMKFSDIRLYREDTPDLPPLAAGLGSRYRGNYAQEAFRDVLHRGKKRRKRPLQTPSAFIQRDAIVETLTSQCQIAAPLLKLFPLAWQRALLGNIVAMCTAIMADFCEGIEFQILGHRLSFAFTPITEEDMMRGMMLDRLRPHRTDPDAFEAAVRATADDVGDNLKFLDRWHERALGSGLLRTQIATLIARLVLTLTDDVLSGSRMDLWFAHAGGPRLLAELEYRSVPSGEGGGGDWEEKRPL